MTLEVLSASESMSLCRAAVDLVLNRFLKLAEQAERGDRKLGQLFRELAGDMERTLVEIRKLDGKDRLAEAPEDLTGQKVAIGFLPSLSKSGNGVCLDRESGFYVVESILEDLGGFYGTLVRQSVDEKSRDLLLRLKSAVRARLDFLRHVVL